MSINYGFEKNWIEDAKKERINPNPSDSEWMQKSTKGSNIEKLTFGKFTCEMFDSTTDGLLKGMTDNSKRIFLKSTFLLVDMYRVTI